MKNYIMSIDPYGYDGYVSSFCLFRKEQDGSLIAITAYSGSNKGLYKDKMEEAIKAYSLSKDQIIDLSDKH